MINENELFNTFKGFFSTFDDKKILTPVVIKLKDKVITGNIDDAKVKKSWLN